MRDIKIGPKVWVKDLKNETLFSELCRVLEAGIADFVEIMTPGGSYEEYCDVARRLPGEIVIHAPHDGVGVEWSDSSRQYENLKLIRDSFQFASDCNAEVIIVHTGADNLVEETARQLSVLNKSKVVLENLPCFACRDGEGGYRGTTDFELKNVLEMAGINGICMDFSHLHSAAISLGMDWEKMLDRMLELNPRIFHLCDGEFGNPLDLHLPLGEGDYPLGKMINSIPAGSMLTLETKNPDVLTMVGFEREVALIESLRKPVHV